MKTKSWEALTNDEKLDRLTSVLTRAGSDRKFRDQCLTSSESAREAISEAGEIEFPPDFEIECLTPRQGLRKLVLAMPDFVPAENGTAQVRNAEDYQLCSYRMWRA